MNTEINNDLDNQDGSSDSQNNRAENSSADNQKPLTTQGSEEEIEENLSGTTSLSLDQLKKEHDPEGNPGE